jgi:broad-specificity NMP kinase
MSFIEITGQPCAGKSTILNKISQDYVIRHIKNRFPKKILYFLSGINFLGLQRLKILLGWSLAENASSLFKINIFFNCVSKFGIFHQHQKSTKYQDLKIVVDEGISHIPFLFLETDSKIVTNFISDELQMINVYILRSPEQDIIQARLLSRGHKRLQFIALSTFTDRIQEIEKVLLSQYPSLCKKFKVFDDVASF